MLVTIGLISFPLYLWHWPVLVYSHVIDNKSLSDITIKFLIIITTFILASFTYVLVEQPLRSKKKHYFTYFSDD